MEFMKERIKHLPGIGQRIIRSVCAVFLCFVVYGLRGQRGIPFYSALAALQCIQPYKESSAKMARQRIGGTLTGAAWGLVVLLFMASNHTLQENMLHYALISLITGAVLYTTVLLGNKSASYFSCVVFLSITVNHLTDENPYLFVYYRVLDTLIGVAMAILVNSIHLPRIKRKDVLFISGVDAALLTQNNKLTPYSKVELNRLIDSGANFTISTVRTPASLMESMEGIHLKHPVIVMDGAAIYDINENAYRVTNAMTCEESQSMAKLLEESGLNYFANVIMDDLLVIFYENLKNQAELDIVKRLGRSPYRNYVKRRLPECEKVVYFLSVAEREKIEAVSRQFREQGLEDIYRFVVTESKDYPGYSNLKIYRKDVSRENMRKMLMELLHLEKSVTFGSVAGHCDILIKNSDKNEVVKQLKKLYEPIGIRTGKAPH